MIRITKAIWKHHFSPKDASNHNYQTTISNLEPGTNTSMFKKHAPFLFPWLTHNGEHVFVTVVSGLGIDLTLVDAFIAIADGLDDQEPLVRIGFVQHLEPTITCVHKLADGQKTHITVAHPRNLRRKEYKRWMWIQDALCRGRIWKGRKIRVNWLVQRVPSFIILNGLPPRQGEEWGDQESLCSMSRAEVQIALGYSSSTFLSSTLLGKAALELKGRGHLAQRAFRRQIAGGTYLSNISRSIALSARGFLLSWRRTSDSPP